MKILELRSSNVKRLKVVEIKPRSPLVRVAGRNGAGKSSTLDSILYALAGTSELPAQPIRRGEASARIELDLGDLVVTRRITDSGSTLTVTTKDGADVSKGQTKLNGLLGDISLDPLEFSRQKPKEQFETLRKVVDVDVDFEMFDGLQDADFRRRAEANKEAKSLRAQMETQKPFPANLPSEPIPTGPIVDRIAQAGEINAGIERKREARAAMERKRESLIDDGAKAMARAHDLRRQADFEDERAQRCGKEAEEIRAKLASYEPLPSPVDPAEAKAELARAEATNREVERKARRDELAAKAEEKEAEAKKYTDRMATREAAKQATIAAAKMPIEGIGFGDGQVLLNGLPFEQASSAEQLRASCAIAMAANPKIRVLLVRDGSLLDDDGMRILEEMAAANDFQIWIETVGRCETAFVIEGGEVVHAPVIEEPVEVESPELAGVS